MCNKNEVEMCKEQTHSEMNIQTLCHNFVPSWCKLCR